MIETTEVQAKSEGESPGTKEKPKRKRVNARKAPGSQVYVSREKEGNEFKIIGIKAHRDQKMPGHCFWKVPDYRVEAFEINHFFKSGRVIRWNP